MPRQLQLSRAIPLAFGVLLALLGAGCGTWIEGPAVNHCGSDADCAAGSCDLERSMCVTRPAAPLVIGLEVVPANDPFGGTVLPVSFPPFELNGPAERELVLPLGVPVRGQVRSVGEPVSAGVTFTLLSEIPGGAPTRIETQTFAEPMREGSEVFDYATQLLPSRVYEVSIQPNGAWRAKLPPLRYRFESTAEGTRIIQSFPYDETLPRVTGVIVDGAGVGQSGLLVRALDAVSGRVVSSTYTTGADSERAPGHFEIVLAPGIEAWLFSVNASSSRVDEGRPSPTFTVDPSALLEGPEGVTLLLPAVSEEVITYGGFIEVAGSPGRGTGATMTLTSRDVVDARSGAVGTYRATVSTNEAVGSEGEFMAQLLPGTYDVLITPTSADLGVLRETVRLTPERGLEVLGQVFQVPPRARFGGRVQTSDAEPMLNAQIRGQARGSTYDGVLADVAVYARSNETVTDPNGQFNLPLDIGLYDVIVEPPSGTNWPWTLRRDVAVGGADTVLEGNVLELGAPVPLRGQAVFTGGTPVAGGEVRAFAIVTSASGSTRTIQIGRAQTDAEGRFTLLLTASL